MTTTTLSPDRRSGAIFSLDMRYRYRLWRILSDDPRRMLFVMLNPSTATATVNDPSVTRCIGFTIREGYGRLDVVNLYAFRATDPKRLHGVISSLAVGPDNDYNIEAASHHATTTVAAWGANADPRRARHVMTLLDHPLCLGLTKAGQPKHPLYIRHDAPLIPVAA